MPNLRTTLAFVAFLAVLVGGTAPAQECPQLVGIWPYGPIRNVGAGADGAVCILTGAALQVLDVHDPAAPLVLGEATVEDSNAESLEVRGERAYVSEQYSLGIVNLSDPQAPALVGAFRYVEDWRHGRFIDAFGERAYVQDGGLRILDVSDPADPRDVGLWQPPTGAGLGVGAAQGTIVFVSTYPQETGVDTLHIVDTAEPANPAELGSLGFADRILGVIAAENLAYVLTASGLSIVDAAAGSEPSVLASYTLPEPLQTSGWYKRLVALGSTAYIRDTRAGRVRIIDVSDPHLPHEEGSFQSIGNVAVAPGYCYVARQGFGLRIVDVSDPASPVEAGTLAGIDLALDIDVRDGPAAIASAYDGLRLLDVSDPAHPVEAALLPAPECSSTGDETFVYRVGRSGHLAFASTNACFWIVDVSDPFTPLSLSTPRFPGWEFAVEGAFAYLCDTYNQSVTIVDATDPITPVQAGMVVGSDAACDHIDVEAQRVYATTNPGLTVVDVSDPWNPFILGTAQSPPYAWGVAVAGPTAVRITQYDGLRVIDVSDPENPSETASMQTPFLEVVDIEMEGNRAYVVDFTGVSVIDVSRPDAPFAAGRSYSAAMHRVAVEHPYVYTLSWETGVRIFDVSGCDAIVFRDDFESGDTSRWPIIVP